MRYGRSYAASAPVAPHRQPVQQHTETATRCADSCSTASMAVERRVRHSQHALVALLLGALAWQAASLRTAKPSIVQPARSHPGGQPTRVTAARHAHTARDVERIRLPNVTSSGYVDVDKELGSSMFYIYYEAREPKGPLDKTPIVVWLQGGPGCSSLFGMLYINGPYWVNTDDLTLRVNPGSWSRLYGMLFIEQPIATGFSKAGKQRIPTGELEVAADLYTALNNWYDLNPSFKDRPLIVTGESYAGKYVPSISHYILQADAQANGYIDKLEHLRALPRDLPAPRFKLGGLAIGNGWTDADSQQLVQGQVAWAMGLIDLTQKHIIEDMNWAVIEQLSSRQFHKARVLSDAVNEYISNWTLTYTLEDVRRNLGYDGYNMVDAYLNQAHVKSYLGADPHITWESCSPLVDKKMRHDVMKSVRKLVVDLLNFHPVLLYQGQWDAECGVASNDAWIQTMKWPGHYDFNHKPRELWKVNGRVMGFWRRHAHLTQLVIRNTGHMVPHDNPYYGQLLLERWVEEEVLHKTYNRAYSEEEEQQYNQIRGTDEGPRAGPPDTDDALEDDQRDSIAMAS